jgi:hypothetical protein
MTMAEARAIAGASRPLVLVVEDEAAIATISKNRVSASKRLVTGRKRCYA